MCLYPKLVKNPKYKPNKKNGGVVPFLWDDRIGFVPVGCGKCIECCSQKSREWKVRLLEEIRTNKDGVFVTLTFSNSSIRRLVKQVEKDCKKEKEKLPEGYALDNRIAKKAVRLFLERWRKGAGKGKSVRHWLITELGHEGTENLHLHGVIFNKDKEAIEKEWKYGWCYFGYSFNEKTVNYIVKYVTKVDKEHKFYVPKILCSKGIGAEYIERRDSNRNIFDPFGITNELYKNRQGYELALPKYYRNKIYDEDQREMLWIEKLDRQERFILGQRVDISENEDLYYRMLKEARVKNTRMGYGDSKKDWQLKEYEESRRNIYNSKRVNG